MHNKRENSGKLSIKYKKLKLSADNCGILNYLPAGLFIMFSLSVFIFSAFPVVEDCGNLYFLFFSGGPELKYCVRAIMISAAVNIIYALFICGLVIFKMYKSAFTYPCFIFFSLIFTESIVSLVKINVLGLESGTGILMLTFFTALYFAESLAAHIALVVLKGIQK